MDSPRILCVDDNPSLLLTIKAGLTIHGFAVIAAGDGLDALRQFNNHSGQFAAIVTDKDMPKMNGLEFVRAVREQNFVGPVFLISGDLKSRDLDADARQGISGFLQKPFSIKSLISQIENSLPAPPALAENLSLAMGN